MIRFTRLSLCLTLFLSISLSLLPRPTFAETPILFIPLIAGEQAQNSSVPVPGRSGFCELNAEEEAVLAAAKSASGQQRAFIVCNPILSEQARAKAADMANRNYFGHTNPDGIAANKLVRDAGYPLPDYYGTDNNANNIESLAAGYLTAEDAWNGWLASSGHRTHVLGEIEFYRNQVEVGVGYYFNPNAEYGHYWVFFSAHQEIE